eukprot:COSAG02_NODE_2353_length_9081_cov_4.981073_4_plen_211_part_00
MQRVALKLYISLTAVYAIMYISRRFSRSGGGENVTGWVRIQSSDGVKTIMIYGVIREKKQRFEVISGVPVFISEFYLLYTIPTQPVRERVLGRRDGVPEPGARWRDVRLRRHVLQQLRPTLADDAPCVVLAVASLRWVQRGGGGEEGAALLLTTRNGFPGWMAARCSCWTGGALRSLLLRLPNIRLSRGLGMPGGAGGRCERGGAEAACS